MSRDESHDALRTTLRHGAVCYLQIPVDDLAATPAFYESVFGWQLDASHSSFEAPGLIGQFVADRRPAPDGGLLTWISVDSVDHALSAVASSGGSVARPPSADGTERLLATICDPSGNALGIVEHLAPTDAAAPA
ncbi:MAG TPA: VOC family protein [Gaiellaceae bacterium]|jgi:hypothetical protein|nr:VOC family protein [Gaiellaceae bacterium]